MDRLTAEELKSRLHYEPTTGVFTRLRSESFRPKVRPGEPAGTKHTKLGYVQIRIGQRRYMAHRLAWFYVHGEWPDGDVDHVNRVTDDNRIENLRVATRSQNMANAKIPRHNGSGVKGVCRDKANGKWMAYAQVNGKFRNFGRFDTVEAASAARAAGFKAAFGEFARNA